MAYQDEARWRREEHEYYLAKGSDQDRIRAEAEADSDPCDSGPEDERCDRMRDEKCMRASEEARARILVQQTRLACRIDLHVPGAREQAD